MVFHSHANKTHFYNKGCALGLLLKVRDLEHESGLLANTLRMRIVKSSGQWQPCMISSVVRHSSLSGHISVVWRTVRKGTKGFIYIPFTDSLPDV